MDMYVCFYQDDDDGDDDNSLTLYQLLWKCTKLIQWYEQWNLMGEIQNVRRSPEAK